MSQNSAYTNREIKAAKQECSLAVKNGDYDTLILCHTKLTRQFAHAAAITFADSRHASDLGMRSALKLGRLAELHLSLLSLAVQQWKK